MLRRHVIDFAADARELRRALILVLNPLARSEIFFLLFGMKINLADPALRALNSAQFLQLLANAEPQILSLDRGVVLVDCFEPVLQFLFFIARVFSLDHYRGAIPHVIWRRQDLGRSFRSKECQVPMIVL